MEGNVPAKPEIPFADYKAMLELSDELSFADAIKFVRLEYGCGLAMAVDIVKGHRLARANTRK